MRLVLFFTRDVSLQTWDDQGMFNREVALYQRLQEQGVDITFVTYGGSGDLAFASRLPGIQILCNVWNLPSRLYAWALPGLHGAALKQGDVFKTNQTAGSEIALRCAQRYGKPLIARCGYLWSNFMARRNGPDSPAHRQAQRVERQVFSAAQQVVVTTPRMADEVSQALPSVADRIVVIPNYVETDRFQPLPALERAYDLVFVGRFSPQKNVAALLTAIEGLDVRLCLIGDGELKTELQQHFAHLSGQIVWHGKADHAELPTYLNQAKIFILPSLYEGHPKALIEAMACGLPVIATQVQGIQDMVTHGQDGWLCGTDASSLRAAIQSVLAQPALQQQIGTAARQTVLTRYALDAIVQQEEKLLHQVLTACSPVSPR
ncbi:MAG: glycosyltransferase family 4 protein [Cyanobacteria bacterium J06632_22]